MHIHPVTPYREDRNLGKAYNDAFALIPDEDYLLITDYDVLLLLPDTIRHCYTYAKAYPNADMFVCWANRTFHTNEQLYQQKVNENVDIRQHIAIAKDCARGVPVVTKINRTISGFLMLIPKRTWNEFKFVEDLKCLGVDTIYSQRLVDAGRTILRMDGIYVWHTYRLEHGTQDKSHLL
jgi:GT2 family glycosyltransferase